LGTIKGTSRNETCAVTRLGTPGNHLAFYVTDIMAWFRRSPEAEIAEIVEVRSLTKRVLVFSGRVADVVATLSATDEPFIRVDFIRKICRSRICF